MRLKGKVALVTGAGGGLGTAIARRFASEGASLLCADRDRDRAEATASAIAQSGGAAHALRADVADPLQCDAQVTETVRRFGRIDIAVNNAGIALHKLALDTSLEDWERVLRINLTGSFLTAPGPIETGISRHGPTRKRGYLDRIPMRRYGNVDAVASAALYLASDECDWVTRHILNVDGGYGAAGLSYDPAEIR